jgi:cleavage and polyadenylation specificity factor subunit 1
LGNSLLLRFKEKDENTVITIDDNDVPTVEKEVQMSKKQRLEEEELLVYGSKTTQTSVHLSSYIFEVCDSLMNLSPIGFMAVGERARTEEHLDENDEDEKRDVSKIELEVVASVGHGKNGYTTPYDRKSSRALSSPVVSICGPSLMTHKCDARIDIRS